jgi:peptidoglycan/LPS O-acetylase OafA/YrhL
LSFILQIIAAMENMNTSAATTLADPQAQPGERRLVALDGLRGLMTLMVIVSHYFGELPHGMPASFGWIAVDMFFVLSGFLIGKLILEKCHHANFFTVFYVRRFCRIVPAYVATVLLLSALLHFISKPWIDAEVQFPLWSYLTFVQGYFMVTTNTIGAHWLAPTWTLAVEEHFYLLVPALIVFTPRRWLISVFLGIVFLTICLRSAIYYAGFGNEMMALALLPGRADTLAFGLLAAMAVKMPGVPWTRLLPALRIFPIFALLGAVLLYLMSSKIFGVLAPLLIAIGCTAYLLCIFHDTPEARRYHSKKLQFFGNNGYCLYLTHLPILGLMHGLILGSKPDLETPSQWLVTIAALPVCVLVGWGMTKLIEEPLSRYGRSWRWGLKSGRPVVTGQLAQTSGSELIPPRGQHVAVR